MILQILEIIGLYLLILIVISVAVIHLIKFTIKDDKADEEYKTAELKFQNDLVGKSIFGTLYGIDESDPLYIPMNTEYFDKKDFLDKLNEPYILGLKPQSLESYSGKKVKVWYNTCLLVDDSNYDALKASYRTWTDNRSAKEELEVNKKIVEYLKKLQK